MRLLLDTHALLWALASPRRLPAATRARIEDPANEVLVSAASTWEIAIKTALGKLTADLDEVVSGIATAGLRPLSISIAHTRRVLDLPRHHRDPFDRLLIAQALEDGLTVVTHDPAFAAYPAPLSWG
jgi:PIN domain nuclease of toxin-antitoxin system